MCRGAAPWNVGFRVPVVKIATDDATGELGSVVVGSGSDGSTSRPAGIGILARLERVPRRHAPSTIVCYLWNGAGLLAPGGVLVVSDGDDATTTVA
jgi:hypothetical protein